MAAAKCTDVSKGRSAGRKACDIRQNVRNSTSWPAPLHAPVGSVTSNSFQDRPASLVEPHANTFYLECASGSMDFACIEQCSQCCVEREYFPSIRFGKIGVLILPDEKERIEKAASDMGLEVSILRG